MAALITAGCSGDPIIGGSSRFILNEKEYFESGGVSVMSFQDIYPEGHQSGVSIIMHGIRIATNGDVRLEPTPGQWSSVPRMLSREVDNKKGAIISTLVFPDSAKNMKGFNPIFYPDLHLKYNIRVESVGDAIKITVDLDQPLTKRWAGRVGFLLELYPVDLFGASWIMDSKSGIFPRQANGPVTVPEGSEPNPRIVPTCDMKDVIPLPHHRAEAVPLAVGRSLSIAPERDDLRMVIESKHGDLELLDGRVQHNNGWFIVRTPIAEGVSKGAVEWIIKPNVIPNWKYSPVIQHSQVGYHPRQNKVAVIETDPKDRIDSPMKLLRISPDGKHKAVLSKQPIEWGNFLRYTYYHFDFSEITQDGMYQLVLGDQKSAVFRISSEVFDRNVWQPTLEYFLPVQMCHMRVREKYKLWHDLCHMDDALMAPVNTNHFDGYVQGPSTLTPFKPMEPVPGLNSGGWHDAGDDDLRIESQAGEIFILSAAWEEFNVTYDNTLIDQELRIVEIHEPDGKPDILQQIEHGYLSVVGAYYALGRLYRGIISPTLSQYVLGGDPAGQTDNLTYDPQLAEHERTATHSGMADDRWVFTEDNPRREWLAISYIASGVNAMRGYNDSLADQALRAAVELWSMERRVDERSMGNKVRAAVELFRVTGEEEYRDFILSQKEFIMENISSIGWVVARVVHDLNDKDFVSSMEFAVANYFNEVAEVQTNTPYGVPYEPHIWGAGWGVQRFGLEQYFLHKAFPTKYGKRYLLNALNFVLGCHPGSNNASFASGVGARSMTVAYGYNRMDYGFIPGGVVSGTALIRPDFPELKEFPYLWQQSEYVMGGGATNFMFLVLAAQKLLGEME